jgi:ammonia channel protein AmtB
MLLIFGFAGFNAASQLTISHPGDGFVVAQATFNSFLACSSGGITSVLLSRFLPWFGHRSWNYGNLVNGSLAGMVIHFIRKNGADDYNGSILFY